MSDKIQEVELAEIVEQAIVQGFNLNRNDVNEELSAAFQTVAYHIELQLLTKLGITLDELRDKLNVDSDMAVLKLTIRNIVQALTQIVCLMSDLNRTSFFRDFEKICKDSIEKSRVAILTAIAKKEQDNVGELIALVDLDYHAIKTEVEKQLFDMQFKAAIDEGFGLKHKFNNNAMTVSKDEPLPQAANIYRLMLINAVNNLYQASEIVDKVKMERANAELIKALAKKTLAMNSQEKTKFLQEFEQTCQESFEKSRYYYEKTIDSVAKRQEVNAACNMLKLNFKQIALQVSEASQLLQLKPQLNLIQRAVEQGEHEKVIHELVRLADHIAQMYPNKSNEEVGKLLRQGVKKLGLEQVDSMELFAKIALLSDALLGIYQEYSSEASDELGEMSAFYITRYSQSPSKELLVNYKLVKLQQEETINRAVLVNKLSLAKEVFMAVQVKNCGQVLYDLESAIGRQQDEINQHKDSNQDKVKEIEQANFAIKTLTKQKNQYKQQLEEVSDKFFPDFYLYTEKAKDLVNKTIPLTQAKPKLTFKESLQHVGNMLSNPFIKLGAMVASGLKRFGTIFSKQKAVTTSSYTTMGQHMANASGQQPVFAPDDCVEGNQADVAGYNGLQSGCNKQPNASEILTEERGQCTQPISIASKSTTSAAHSHTSSTDMFSENATSYDSDNESTLGTDVESLKP